VSYQEERSELNSAVDESTDADVTTKLQRLAALAEAAFSISQLQVEVAIHGKNTPAAAILKRFAAERVKATENLQFPEGTSEALADVLDNAGIPPQRILGRDN
jgi:hypothetical protein